MIDFMKENPITTLVSGIAVGIVAEEICHSTTGRTIGQQTIRGTKILGNSVSELFSEAPKGKKSKGKKSKGKKGGVEGKDEEEEAMVMALAQEIVAQQNAANS